MNTEHNRIHIDQLTRPEGEQDPRICRREKHRDELQDIFHQEGYVSPIIISQEDHLVVDGNYRLDVLELLGKEDERFTQLEIIGKREGYLYALPVKEIEIDPERASMELNLYRENNSQADCARFLNYLIETRIIEGNESGVNVDATPSELLTRLEHHRQRDDEWQHTDEVKSQLDRFMSDLNFGSAVNARTYLNYLNDSPKCVREAWGQAKIKQGHVEHLKEIAKHVDEDELEQYVEETVDDEQSVRDLIRIKKQLRDDSGQPKNPDSGGLDEGDYEQFCSQEVSAEDQARAERIAEWDDGPPGDILKQCYQMHREDQDFRAQLRTAVDEIEAMSQKLANRKKARQQALEGFDFTADSRFADGEADHLAVPVETENLGVFFHDVQQMDDEVDDEELDLIFTSPPYFTQSDRIVERWWPEDVEYTDENITEGIVDRAYQNYLDEMIEILDLLHAKLEQGRYLILNISDTKAYGVDTKGYDIPSDLSYLIRHELNQRYEQENQFNYDATIAWDKGESQTHDRNASFYGNGKPLTFHPNWRAERLLVFRKGERSSPDSEFSGLY